MTTDTKKTFTIEKGNTTEILWKVIDQTSKILAFHIPTSLIIVTGGIEGKNSIYPTRKALMDKVFVDYSRDKSTGTFEINRKVNFKQLGVKFDLSKTEVNYQEMMLPIHKAFIKLWQSSKVPVEKAFRSAEVLAKKTGRPYRLSDAIGRLALSVKHVQASKNGQVSGAAKSIKTSIKVTAAQKRMDAFLASI